MKSKKNNNNNNKKRKEKCKIENVNNFFLRLKIEMIIFIIFYKMYYTKFIKITSNNSLV